MPLASSIDNFLDAHRDDDLIPQVGKLAIVRGVLEAEARSKMMVDPGNIYNRLDPGALKGTWYNAFFSLLTENCRFADLEARLRQIAVVSFNYDRCFRHYLYSALQIYYGINGEQAASALSNLEIHHPYGAAGNLPWFKAEESIAFGETPIAAQLVLLGAAIRTFPEGSSEQTSDVARLQRLMASAKRIAFLGFAFHQQNMELLFPSPLEGAPERGCLIFSTGIGLSVPDAEVITKELLRLGGVPSLFSHIARDVTCAKLFDEFRRSLSFR
jgi:hypothetical protein